ncbi:hypothetical protein AB0N19_28135, partial [Streptomyces sp. NPDC051132]|uniref:hypothetical protein n=1 Tax=Streptomyces sp. NPDC051132 TaxID=3155667 RepID=UPI003446B81B
MSTAIVTGQPVPGSSLEHDLRSLGFDVRVAADAGAAESLLAAVPAPSRGVGSRCTSRARISGIAPATIANFRTGPV